MKMDRTAVDYALAARAAAQAAVDALDPDKFPDEDSYFAAEDAARATLALAERRVAFRRKLFPGA
jgi:hypothetical protein